MKRLILLLLAVVSAPAVCQDSCDNSEILISKDHCEAHVNGQDFVGIGAGVLDRIRIDNGVADAFCQWKSKAVKRNRRDKYYGGLSCCIRVEAGQTYSSNSGSIGTAHGGKISTACNKATPSCTEGAMSCDGPMSPNFTRCDHGAPVHFQCAPGTVCNAVSPGVILCDFPR